MQRATWTDERLDDLATAMRDGFARVDQDIRDMRIELKGEIAELRQMIMRFGGAMLVGQFGLIAAILARGV